MTSRIIGAAVATLFSVFPALAALAADAPTFGYTEPSKLIKVSSLESGILADLMVREGDQIKKGQVVAKLDTRLVESDRAIAEE